MTKYNEMILILCQMIDSIKHITITEKELKEFSEVLKK